MQTTRLEEIVRILTRDVCLRYTKEAHITHESKAERLKRCVQLACAAKLPQVLQALECPSFVSSDEEAGLLTSASAVTSSTRTHSDAFCAPESVTVTMTEEEDKYAHARHDFLFPHDMISSTIPISTFDERPSSISRSGLRTSSCCRPALANRSSSNATDAARCHSLTREFLIRSYYPTPLDGHASFFSSGSLESMDGPKATSKPAMTESPLPQQVPTQWTSDFSFTMTPLANNGPDPRGVEKRLASEWSDEGRVVFISWIPRELRAPVFASKRSKEVALKAALIKAAKQQVPLSDCGDQDKEHERQERLKTLSQVSKLLLFPPKGTHCKLVFSTQRAANAFLSIYGGDNEPSTELWKMDICSIANVRLTARAIKYTTVTVELAKS